MVSYVDIDNRNLEDVVMVQEARIEALRRRILELQAENEALKKAQAAAHGTGKFGAGLWTSGG